jgi:DNA polymerase-1
MSGTPAEKAYNLHFIDKYSGIKKWHQSLQTEAIKNKCITLPTGRQFAFPHAKRTKTGGATGATKIKNYPVQALATADIVPLCLVALREELQKNKLRTTIVNTVHDSVLLDCPNEEVDRVEQLVEDVLSPSSTKDRIYLYYNINMDVPLPIDTKTGSNWLNMS